MVDPRLRAYGLAGLVFLLDRFTKSIIEARLSLLDTYSVIPGFFDIVHSQNKGVAFSLFHDSTSPWRTTALITVEVVALALVSVVLWNTRERWSAVGLSLILGGALGNVFDRIAWGSVTDFLDFYIGALHWPAFNVADSAVVVGSAFLLVDLLKPKRQPART